VDGLATDPQGSGHRGGLQVMRLTLTDDQALAVLAALEAWQDEHHTTALEAPIGRLTATGLASPYNSALEALEARYGPL
jgi:hypothetical protein